MNEIEIIDSVTSLLAKEKKTSERYKSVINNLRNRKTQAKLNKYRLGVIGVTSSGKSTLINSFFGEKLLPASAKPSSNQLVHCYKSTEKKARIIFDDKDDLIYTGKDVSLTKIQQYAEEQYNLNNKESVKLIEIGTPTFAFPEEMIIVDSPGLDANNHEDHEKLTMNILLPTVDFCIFITTCKTNSDEKMLSVLNTISEYEKPLIIVQNMIDSLKPSPDGLKSVEEVAQDHRHRIEKIISKSNIKDKGLVQIIQISSVWALEGLLKSYKTKEEKKVVEDNFEKSNFKQLVDSVISILNKTKPVIEQYRIKSLKKELQKVQKEAEEDGLNAKKINELKFEFEGYDLEITEKYCAFDEEIRNSIALFCNKKEEIKKIKTVTNKTVEEYNQFEKNTVDTINKIIVNSNQLMKEICDKINYCYRPVSLADYSNNYNDIVLRKKTITRREKEKGIKGAFKRFGGRVTGNSDLGYYRYYESMTDNVGTKLSIIKRIDSLSTVLEQSIGNWKYQTNNFLEIFTNQMEIKRSAFNDRKQKVLNSCIYKEIAEQLKNIISDIIIENEHIKIDNKSIGYKAEKKESLSLKISTYNIYKLAKAICNQIQMSVYNCILDLDKKNYVIGWDRNSESLLLKNLIGVDISYGEIKEGEQIIHSTVLLHNPAISLDTAKHNNFFKYKNKNILILVNAIQFGAAVKQIEMLQLASQLTVNDSVYFVIQDFNEIINADCVDETLFNILGLAEALKIKMKCTVALQHENPLFNMACLQVQVNGCQTQKDEIELIKSIRNSFYYLYNDKISNLLGKIIKTMK